MEKRETAGKIAAKLLMSAPVFKHPMEVQKEIHEKNYMESLKECVLIHKNIFPEDFYVVVVSRKHKTIPNAYHDQFMATLACPTSQFDQAVFKYHYKEENLEFLWAVPDEGTCYHLRDNAHLVVPEEQSLLNFVLQFFDGSLDYKAKQLNGEQPDSLLLQ